MSQRIALVTGASSGIGRATAELLARNGYYVFAAARRVHRLEQIRSDHIEPIQLDVTNEEVVRKAVRILMKKKCNRGVRYAGSRKVFRLWLSPGLEEAWEVGSESHGDSGQYGEPGNSGGASSSPGKSMPGLAAKPKIRGLDSDWGV